MLLCYRFATERAWKPASVGLRTAHRQRARRNHSVREPAASLFYGSLDFVRVQRLRQGHPYSVACRHDVQGDNEIQTSEVWHHTVRIVLLAHTNNKFLKISEGGKNIKFL